MPCCVLLALSSLPRSLSTAIATPTRFLLLASSLQASSSSRRRLSRLTTASLRTVSILRAPAAAAATAAPPSAAVIAAGVLRQPLRGGVWHHAFALKHNFDLFVCEKSHLLCDVLPADEPRRTKRTLC
jgi:hypothetical protein